MITRTFDTPPLAIPTTAFPPIPDLIPATPGLWTADGGYLDREIRIAYIQQAIPDERRQRLLAVQLAMRPMPLYETKYPTDLRPRQAIIGAEAFADGRISREELRRLRHATAATAASAAYAAYAASAAYAVYAAYAAAYATAAAYAAAHATYAAERLRHLRIVTLWLPPSRWDDSWESSNAWGLADAIYHERAWDRMPILADALEDAGCDLHEWLLPAMRHPETPWGRGCWIVDKLRGVV